MPLIIFCQRQNIRCDLAGLGGEAETSAALKTKLPPRLPEAAMLRTGLLSVGVAGVVKIAFGVVNNLESNLGADVLHGVVFSEHLAGDFIQFFQPADFN